MKTYDSSIGKFAYERFGPNILLNLLLKPDFASSLAYLCDFKNHKSLDVIPHEHHIEVSNNKITIAIVLYAGFENKGYEDIKSRKNLHIIALDAITPTMVEFKKLNVKYIDKLSWFFMIISCSKLKAITDLKLLKNLYL